MTIVVEDGSRVTGAESYVTVAAFAAYWTARNDTTTAALATSVIEAALRQATAFLDANFKWMGLRVSTTQSLNWPRALPSGLDADGRSVSTIELPQVLKDACCELAKEAVAGSLAATVARGGAIKSQSVGSISITYADGASPAKKYQLVELLVRRLLDNGGNSLTSSVRRA